MNGLIKASLKNPHAVAMMSLTLMVVGYLSIAKIPIAGSILEGAPIERARG